METLWNFYSAWWSNIAGRIKHLITADISIVVIRPGKTGIAELLLERTVMAANPNADKRAKPFINVTPLIDVLLVLLIIFMVVSPLKQARFVAKLPAPPNPPDRPLPPPPWALVVSIEPDRTLKLNSLPDMGTVEDPGKLSTKLVEVFKERRQNHAYRYELLNRADLPDDLRIEKTVFIKAPRTINYGDVVKVIDGIKVAGGAPIGLQLEGLN